MNVLLVDDEAPALRALADAVSAVLPDARRHSFTSSQEALTFAERTQIDIAFLDILMPLPDGITLAKKLRRMYPGCSVIFCTAHDRYAIESMEAEPSYYLLKPITAEKIREATVRLRYPITAERKNRMAEQ